MTKKDAMPYMKHYLSYLYDDDFTEIDRLTRSFYWDFYLLAWNADANGGILNLSLIHIGRCRRRG